MFLIEKLAVLRLRQRLVDDDASLFRIGRDAAVPLGAGEWDAIGARFRAPTRRSANHLRWALVLQVPVAIVLLMLTVRIGWLDDAATWLDGVAPGSVVLGCTVTLPLIAFLHHNRVVLAEIDAIRATLERRPAVPVGDQPHARWVRVFQIGVLLWFGPGVFIDIYGTIDPGAFVNTPWTGRRIGWVTMLGALAFAGVVALEHARRRRGDASPPPEGAAPVRRRGLVATRAGEG